MLDRTMPTTPDEQIDGAYRGLVDEPKWRVFRDRVGEAALRAALFDATSEGALAAFAYSDKLTFGDNWEAEPLKVSERRMEKLRRLVSERRAFLSQITPLLEDPGLAEWIALGSALGKPLRAALGPLQKAEAMARDTLSELETACDAAMANYTGKEVAGELRVQREAGDLRAAARSLHSFYARAVGEQNAKVWRDGEEYSKSVDFVASCLIQLYFWRERSYSMHRWVHDTLNPPGN